MDASDLKALLGTVITPPVGPLLLIAIGLLLVGRVPRAGRRIAVTGCVLAWLLSCGIGADLLGRVAESGQQPLTLADIQTASATGHRPRAIVILGGGAVRDGAALPRRERLHSRTLERVAAGARLHLQTGLPVLVSGGRPDYLEHSEAELMKRVLEDDFRVPVRWVESVSRDTAENAKESALILRQADIDTVILVTHAYHMTRAQASFERAGLKVLPAPHDWRSGRPTLVDKGEWLPSALSVESAWLFSHELIGRLWYRLRGLG